MDFYKDGDDNENAPRNTRAQIASNLRYPGTVIGGYRFLYNAGNNNILDANALDKRVTMIIPHGS